MKNIKTFKVRALENWNNILKKGNIYTGCYWSSGKPTNNKSEYIHIVDAEDAYPINCAFITRLEIVEEKPQVEIVTYELQPYIGVWKAISNKDNKVDVLTTNVDKFSCKVIYNGNTTIVILEDGSKGISKCLPCDTYDRDKGRDIAYNRATIKSYEKKLKALCK
jgi:hypothetical protein